VTVRRVSLALFVAVLSTSTIAGENNTEKSAAVDWAGLYLGGSIGYADAELRNRYDAPAGPFGFIKDDAEMISAHGSHSFSGASSLFGLEAGYNLQFGNKVVGLEADINRLALKQSTRSSYDTPFAGAGSNAVSDELPWLATFRPRLGYVFGRTLLYATGGLAVAEVRVNETTTSLTNAGNDSYSSSRLMSGWAFGVGTAYALDSHWTVKAEYLYVDLGGLDGTSYTKSPLFMATMLVPYSHEFDANINIARIGADYRF
jgi:outer membrane immunogenic protein